MQKIYKYELKVTDKQEVQMQKGATVLDAQVQKGALCIWVLVNPLATKESRTFEIFGTGHPMTDIPEDRKYIATFQLQGGLLVFHLFERMPL